MFPVAGIALHEIHVRRHRVTPAGGQIIEHHHRVAGLTEGEDRVAAHVSGAAGDEHRALTHGAPPRRAEDWSRNQE